MFKHNKKRNLLFLTLACLFITSLWSMKLLAAEETQGKILKVGFVSDYGVSLQGDGTVSGYIVDYLNEISKYTGWSYEYVECGWAEGISLLEKGEIDLFGPMQKTAEREEVYEFHDRQLGVEYGTLYMQSGRKDIFYNDPNSYDGKKIATVTDNYFNKALYQYCLTNGITMEYIVTTADRFEEGLKSGEFDLAIGGSTLHLSDTVVAGKISAEPFYYATTKGNHEILSNLNKALEEIYIDDAYFEAELFEKYYSTKCIAMPSYTREESRFLDSLPSLSMVCNPDWIPMSYYDDKTNRMTGIGVKIVEEMCRETGIKLQLLWAESFEEASRMLQNGEAQLMLGFEQLDYQLMHYTNSLLRVPMVLAGTGPIENTDEINVGIHCPSGQIEEEIRISYPNYHYVEYDSVRELLLAMEKGREQYGIFNYYAYDELQWCTPETKFSMSVTDVSFDIYVGVSKTADKSILPILNKSIKRINAEQISAIAFDNTSIRSRKHMLRRVLEENWLYIIAIAFSFFLIILIIILFTSHKKKRALKKLAYYDELTGVYKTDKFRYETLQLLAHGETCYILAGLDINKFRYINEAYGYEVGDRVLLAIIKHIKGLEGGQCLIGRMSGDHFMILIKKQELSMFLSHLEKMDYMVHREVENLPISYRVTYSLGYYQVENTGESFSTLLDKVNAARKSSKEVSQNCVMEYTSAMDLEIQWQKEVTLYMEQALRNREFAAYFQPKYEVKSGKIAGAEALVRWIHPIYGFLPPMKFIPLFEKNGFVKKLDYYMFEEVCRFLSSGEKEREQLTISVNLSRIHLQNDALAGELTNMLERYGVNPKQIEVELTENILMEYSEKVLSILNQIKEAGMEISIDDFGSGYSSLSILADLPVGVLKIDKGFVDRMISTVSGKDIVRKIIELAKELSLTTVAEGVETKEQVVLLEQMGCNLIQGYYYSKPLPEAEFIKQLKNEKEEI